MDKQMAKHDKGRRQVLKKIMIGTGALCCYSVLPERWTRPIIGQIALPAHAQTSGPLTCSCQLSGLIVNGTENNFSAFYSWQCLNTAETRLMITGPGTMPGYGYVEPNFSSATSGSRTFTNTPPYGGTTFTAGETYIFTLTLEDINGVILQTSVESVVAI